MNILPSNIVTAFSEKTIGSKVVHPVLFVQELRRAVAAHDFTTDRVPGQAFIQLPDAVPFVSAGVGPRSMNEEDYIVRIHRGRASAYLKREKAAPVEGCAVVVYTTEAYLADPDIHEEPGEIERVKAANPTHILVAVLAFAGPSSTYDVHRFVANLAGGNKEALVWTADEIREKAAGVAAYDNAWVPVAD